MARTIYIMMRRW